MPFMLLCYFIYIQVAVHVHDYFSVNQLLLSQNKIYLPISIYVISHYPLWLCCLVVYVQPWMTWTVLSILNDAGQSMYEDASTVPVPLVKCHHR